MVEYKTFRVYILVLWEEWKDGMNDNRNHGRAPDKTQISLALPITLLKQIEQIATHDQRNRSNCIVRLQSDAVAQSQAGQAGEVGLRPDLAAVESVLGQQSEKSGRDT